MRQRLLWRSRNLRAPLRFLSMAAAVRAFALLPVHLGAGDSGPPRHRAAGTADLPRAFVSCRIYHLLNDISHPLSRCSCMVGPMPRPGQPQAYCSCSLAGHPQKAIASAAEGPACLKILKYLLPVHQRNASRQASGVQKCTGQYVPGSYPTPTVTLCLHFLCKLFSTGSSNQHTLRLQAISKGRQLPVLLLFSCLGYRAHQP